MTEDEYRGMRNPYYMYELYVVKEKIDWESDENGVTASTKKEQKIKDLGDHYKKNNIKQSIKNLFDPKGDWDENNKKWSKYPSPLYPFVEQWWDEKEEDWVEEEIE
jgi:hypothetical protein